MVNQDHNIVKWPNGQLDFSNGSLIMGILNVTPDSFSDGGQFFGPDAAIEHAMKMAYDGAAIIDIGSESTRPGSKPVPTNKQMTRAIPVIEELARIIKTPICIDTSNFEVAQAALSVGAAMINDITALADDRMAKLAADKKVPVILMHMQGTPKDMQKKPKYKNVVEEVLKFLLDRAKHAQKFGIQKKKIFIDPGIGFGKTLEHNLELLRNLDKFVETGYRVLIGTSRKGFIGKITGKEKTDQRLFGTAATVALSISAGASIVRVHDIPQMLDVVKIARAITTM